MPRNARQKSTTDVYHVMLRGINRQSIFEDEEDYRRFLLILRDCKRVSGFKLYAFCLMPNHIHLLIHVIDEPLDLIIKRIGSRFVYWYNMKYERVGHLFQDRFRSEPVEDDAYFLTVLRYIVQNPMKSGLEAHPGAYRWNCYRDYAASSSCLTDTDFADGFFATRADLLAYLCQHNDDRALDIRPARIHITDEKAAALAAQITGCVAAPEFQRLQRQRQLECVSQLRQHNLSLAQISRATGISPATVSRILKCE